MYIRKTKSAGGATRVITMKAREEDKAVLERTRHE